jgi:hypothetical protein
VHYALRRFICVTPGQANRIKSHTSSPVARKH